MFSVSHITNLHSNGGDEGMVSAAGLRSIVLWQKNLRTILKRERREKKTTPRWVGLTEDDDFETQTVAVASVVINNNTKIFVRISYLSTILPYMNE